VCLNGTIFTLSFELSDAPCKPTAPQRVRAWLYMHRNDIRRSAKRFSVSATAVGGTIAYEALADVHFSSVFGLTRSIGPGKVHYKAGYFQEGLPVAKQVEELGYVPQKNVSGRIATLRTASGSTTYIAAIMRSFADVVRRADNLNIGCNDALLITLYTGYDLKQAPIVALQPDSVESPGALWLRDQGRFVYSVLPRDVACS